VGLRTGYLYHWNSRIFIRGDLSGNIAIVRYKFYTETQPDNVPFASPPAYLTFALGVGIGF
jgi:hypothetical protein